MIRHLLLISFNDDATPYDIETVRTTFLNLPEHITGVQRVEWRCNDSQEDKHAGFTHCVMMTFRDELARQYYLPHPQYDALKSVFLPILHHIIVIDYPVTPGNISICVTQDLG
ncbi:Dabb family protein [Yersinia enterocolitica]|nr:Dabb family protein [Yersinia enterocolitica]EKN5104622.1 Dabb family protein [Yersinia enterocolitica]